MNTKTIYEQIYDKIITLIPNLENMAARSHQVYKARGYGCIYLNILSEEKKERLPFKIISLTHYYEQNGDLIPDPDMTIKIYSHRNMAEALTFQNCFTYQEVYPTKDTVNLTLKKQLNSFLKSWLTRCIVDMGHKFTNNEMHGDASYVLGVKQ